MNDLTLAVRNVFRNRRRTAITFSSIIAAASAIIVFGGFVSFTFEGLREKTIRTQLGHFQIAAKGYFDQGAGLSDKFLLEHPERIEQALRNSPLVEATTWRLSGSGLVTAGDNSLSARLVGVLPEREEGFAAFETVRSGMQLDPDTPDGCVIGYGLAQGLKVQEGARLTILGTTLEGMVNAVDCTLSGVVQTGAREYDNVYLKLPLPLLQRLLNTQKVEKILVLAQHTGQSAEVEALVRTTIADRPDLEYRSWLQLAEFYRGVVNLYTTTFGLASIVLGVIVFLSIANTMGMSAFERFREIGALRAIGQTRLGIVRMFVYEGAVIGVLGGCLGTAAGIGLAGAINRLGGIAVAAPPGMSTGYTALIAIDPRAVAIAFLMALVAATLSSCYPAWLASRIAIVKALNHV